ncbi:MAG: DUF559 domain-containing protein, partial [Ilumatobacteraceae bacterium]
GPQAVTSHRSAARLWGVARSDTDPIDVSMPHRNRRSQPSGVLVHFPRDVEELRAIPRNGVPTTSPLRMIIDLAADDPGGVSDALQHLVTAQVVRPSAIRAVLERHARPGRTGVNALRAALAEWPLDDHVPDSLLETKMAALLRRHQLPTATFHAIVEGYEVDFLLDRTQIVIECDGHASHGLNRDQFEYDRLRDSDLLAAGYIVVRVTWNRVVHHSADVARRIRAAVRRWAPEVP